MIEMPVRPVISLVTGDKFGRATKARPDPLGDASDYDVQESWRTQKKLTRIAEPTGAMSAENCRNGTNEPAAATADKSRN